MADGSVEHRWNQAPGDLSLQEALDRLGGFSVPGRDLGEDG